MRNIFAVPADLPVITPHHAGLNLEHPPEREAEVLAEIDELRRKIHAVRLTLPRLDLPFPHITPPATEAQTPVHPRGPQIVQEPRCLPHPPRSPRFPSLRTHADPTRAPRRARSDVRGGDITANTRFVCSGAGPVFGGGVGETGMGDE